MNEVVVAGAGAHCKVVLDILLGSTDYKVMGLIDSDQEKRIFDIPVIGTDEDLERLYRQGARYGFVAIGSNAVRRKVQEKMEAIGYEIISLVSRHAVISGYAQIGAGTVVMPGAVVNAGAKIGKGCIINTNCSVDHDCRVGEFCHIAPGCAVSGSTHIGQNVFLGTGTRVIDYITIGENTMVGAGATVISDLPSDCLAVGTPAVVKRSNKENKK